MRDSNRSEIKPLQLALVSYGAPALALMNPLAKSVGSEVTAEIVLQELYISWITIALVVCWILSGVVNSTQRHEHIGWCVINSLGFPGVVLALIAYVP